MKRLLIALALTCVLTGSALAEDVHTCGITSPSDEATETTAPGDVPSTDYQLPRDVETCGLTATVLTMLDLVF